MEHARHQRLESLGIDFAALHQEGIDLMVSIPSGAATGSSCGPPFSCVRQSL
jgi:hypothetical protein